MSNGGRRCGGNFRLRDVDPFEAAVALAAIPVGWAFLVLVFL